MESVKKVGDVGETKKPPKKVEGVPQNQEKMNLKRKGVEKVAPIHQVRPLVGKRHGKKKGA